MSEAGSPAPRIRVLLVDDHEVVRTGISTFLQVVPEFELVGEAGDGKTAVRLCEELHPDVVLLDMVMPDMDGPTTALAIRGVSPMTRIVALTSFPEDDLIVRALEAGVLGYLLKNVGSSELAAAIRAAHAGKATLAPEATLALMQRATRPPAPGHNLSPREREVLKLMAKGLTNRQIAAALVVSSSTADFHVSNVLGKLGVASRTEAVALAFEHHLTD